MCCIDALSFLQKPGNVKNGKRFKDFARNELKSFSDEEITKRFYEDFRCGLVHEARLKNGAQFILETSQTITYEDPHFCINPLHLAEEVRAAIESYVKKLEADKEERMALAARIREEFQKDFVFSKSEGSST